MVVEYLTTISTTFFSTILGPFSALQPIWGLTAVSIVSGVLLALVYGKISNQGALKRVKRSISAGIFESVLFRHDVRASLRAQVGMLWGGVRYFAIAVPPILALLVPSLLILSQLHLRYGSRALASGESTVVTVEVTNDDALFDASLTGSSGILTTPPLRDLDARRVSWRIDTKQSKPGTAAPLLLNLTVSGVSAEQPLYVDQQPTILPAELHTSPVWQFLYPGGSVPLILRKHVRSIVVRYPDQELIVAGIHLHWLVLFACTSILAGLVASKVFDIEI